MPVFVLGRGQKDASTGSSFGTSALGLPDEQEGVLTAHAEVPIFSPSVTTRAKAAANTPKCSVILSTLLTKQAKPQVASNIAASWPPSSVQPNLGALGRGMISEPSIYIVKIPRRSSASRICRYNVSPIIWNNVQEPQGVQVSKLEMDIFAYLEDAMRIPPDGESPVNDFVVFLLKMLEYDAGRHKEMAFLMCGMKVDAKPGVILFKHSGGFAQYILLIQATRHGDDPEPQLIAEVIAAFYQNNSIRDRAGLQPLASQTLPAITMVGTAAEFYKITITQDLQLSVEGEEYPAWPTVVKRLLLPIPDLANYNSQGMLPLENRRILLKCFEAFKRFLNDDA